MEPENGVGGCEIKLRSGSSIMDQLNEDNGIIEGAWCWKRKQRGTAEVYGAKYGTRE
jgi:hypothetical protein